MNRSTDVTLLKRNRISMFRFLDFIPDLMLAGSFLLVWLKPSVFSGRLSESLRMVLVAELFLLVSIAVILWYIRRIAHLTDIAKPIAVLFFCGFSFFWIMFSVTLYYTSGFSLANAAVLWFVFFSKFQGLIASLYSASEIEKFAKRIFGSLTMYIIMWIAMLNFPLPELGMIEIVDPEFNGLFLFGFKLKREVAFGFFYFFFLAVFEIYSGFKDQKSRIS